MDLTEDKLDQAAADAEEDHFQMIAEAEAEAGGCLGLIFLLFLPAIIIRICA